MDNRTIARQLMQRARYLGDQKASLYRVRAYRRAAETVLGLDEPIETMVAQIGSRALRNLPAIGSHIAKTIETLVQTGTLPTLTEASEGKPVNGPREPWESGEETCNVCAACSK